ncbi:hypothetical protein AB5I41_02665 [Sphingomonas sp. MMS24-JH45]
MTLRLAAAALLTGLPLAASAQSVSPPPARAPAGRGAAHDPVRRQQLYVRRAVPGADGTVRNR